MYNWDDILIVGDSWCSERHSLLHWPNILLSELTGINEGIPRGKGFPGCSWWSIRKKLFNELNHKPAKVIIIIHTDPSRIPNDMDSGMTISMAVKTVTIKGRWETQEKSSIAKAAAEYYAHLYSPNFHKWTEQRWFEELDTFLLSHKDAKIIHLYGLRNQNDNHHRFNIGVTIESPLHQYLITNTEKLKYPNHMTMEHNDKMALSLKNMILNYPGNGFVHKERLFEK